MIEYPAKIEYSKTDKCYLVQFPDLPGCHTYGDTLEEAQDMASEALTGYLGSIDSRSIKIPEPSNLKGGNVYYIKPDAKTAFAIWMKLTRMKKGLTQQKAAELMGIQCQAYQKYENPRKANPTLVTMIKIEKIFGEQILV